MKRRIFTLILLTVTLLTSCDGDTEFSSEYTRSLHIWAVFRESSGNSYVYTVSDGSNVGGVAWETKIYVVNGHVSERAFRFTWTEGLPENYPAEELTWLEHANSLNTHPNSPAAAVLTLDKIYQKAKNDWLEERKNTIAYFETENEGMISLCGYVPKGCQDDCFRGISIDSIEPTN